MCLGFPHSDEAMKAHHALCYHSTALAGGHGVRRLRGWCLTLIIDQCSSCNWVFGQLADCAVQWRNYSALIPPSCLSYRRRPHESQESPKLAKALSEDTKVICHSELRVQWSQLSAAFLSR